VACHHASTPAAYRLRTAGGNVSIKQSESAVSCAAIAIKLAAKGGSDLPAVPLKLSYGESRRKSSRISAQL